MSTTPTKGITPRIFHYSKEKLCACLERNRIIDTMERREAAYRNMSSLIYCMNDLAGFTLFDAFEALRSSPLYKREIKQQANIAMKAFKAYEKELLQFITKKDRYQIFLDMADEYQSYMQPHVNKLRLAILAALTRLQIPNRLVLSHVATAQAMLATCTIWFEDYFSWQKGYFGVDLRDHYKFANLKDIRKRWEFITHTLIPSELQRAVCDTNDFQLAAKIINLQGQDRKKLNACAEKAFKKNNISVEEIEKELNLK